MQHWDLSCGAAALATVLKYHFGEDTDERTVAQGLVQRDIYLDDPEILQKQHGFSLLDLKQYVDRIGYRGAGYGGLELAHLEDMAPLIVPIRVLGYNHYVVFNGRHGDRVSFADPAFGQRTMSRQAFERAWLSLPGIGRVGFTIKRNGETADHGPARAPLKMVPRPDDRIVRQAMLFRLFK